MQLSEIESPSGERRPRMRRFAKDRAVTFAYARNVVGCGVTATLRHLRGQDIL